MRILLIIHFKVQHFQNTSIISIQKSENYEKDSSDLR